ncbi:dockerin type I domain-containing protein [Planctomycetaceae bacterium SH139]
MRSAKTARLRLEVLEKRELLAAAIMHPWDTEIRFDQFSGGDAKVFAVGYTDSGTEQPSFAGFEFCFAGDCGGQPIQLGDITDSVIFGSFGAQAVMEIRGRLGLEYGLYANAGSADLIYDGTFSYEVVDTGSGPIEIKTSVDHAAGGMFTQTPTVRAFADLVVEFDGSIRTQACFIDCIGPGVVEFEVDETISLASLNRNANGKVEIIGTSLLSDAVGVYEQLGGAKQTIQTSDRDLFKAERDGARAVTPSQTADADQAKQSATQRKTQGQNSEADTRQRVRSGSSNKKFGGGKIIQVSIGEAPNDLLGVELDLGIGVGWKGAVNIGKELGSISLTVPDIALTDTTIDAAGVLSAETEQSDSRRDVAKLTTNVGAILGGGFGFGRTDIDVAGISIGLTTADYVVETSLRLNQDVSSTPAERAKFDFVDPITGQPALVDVTIDGTLLQNISTVEFDVGSSVFVETGTRKIAVQPKLIPRYKFANDFGLDLDVEGTLRALALEISAFGKSFVSTDPLLVRSNPIGQHDFGSIFDTSFHVEGELIDFEPFIVGGPVADLLLATSASPKTGSGSLLTNDQPGIFQIIVTNQGPQVAENISIRTELPTGEHGSISVNTSSLDSQTMELIQPDLLVSRLPTLAPGASHTFTFEATPTVLRSRTLNVFNRATSDSRDSNLFNNSSRLEVDTTKNVRIFVDNFAELIGPLGDLDKCPNQPCSLRGAIRLANANPGPDVILLRSGDYTLLGANGPLQVTDSLSIFAFPGTTIRFDRSEITAALLRDEQKLVLRIPTPPGDVAKITAQQLVDTLNSISIGTTFPFDAFPVTAEIKEGDGSGTFEFGGGESLLFEDVFPIGNNGLTAQTINPDGPNNAFSIKLRNPADAEEFGSLFSGLDVELQPFTPSRTRIFEFGGSGENDYLVRGLTLVEGDASNSADPRGGAIQLADPDDHLELDNVKIVNSFASTGGALAVLNGASATVKRATFSGNAASDFGGAIHVSNSSVVLEDVLFENNQAGSEGGAIDNFASAGRASQIDLRNITVHNNTAPVGAGISNLSQDDGSRAFVTVKNSAFWDNEGGNAESYAFDGQAAIESLGFNLDSDGTLQLSGLGDRSNVLPVSIDTPFIKANSAGTFIGNLTVNLPGVASPVSFSVDDSRFAVEAGVLRLKPGEAIAASGNLTNVSIDVMLTDGDGQQLVQPLILQVQPATVPPQAFTLLSTSSTSATFSWEDQTHEQNYRLIELSPGGEERIVLELDANAIDATLESLPILSQAAYVLEAVNQTSTARTQPLTVQLPAPAPEVPRDLKVDRMATTLTVNWGEADFADSYLIFHNNVQVGSTSTNTTTFQIDNLIPDSAHTVQVRAVNKTGASGTQVVSVVTLPLPAAAPTQFQISPFGNDRLRLTWDASSNGTEQRIHVSENGASPELLVKLDAGVSQFDTAPLNVDSTYEFYLSGLNISGQGRAFGLGVSVPTLGSVDTVIVENAQGSVDVSPIFALHPALSRLVFRGPVENTLSLSSDLIENIAPANNQISVETTLATELDLNSDFRVAPSEFTGGLFYRIFTDGRNTFKIHRPDHFHNLVNQFDVDSSGEVAPLDALVVINYLNRNGIGVLPQPNASTSPNLFIDTNRDLEVTPIDALRIINFLNRNGTGSSGEGESEAVLSTRVDLNYGDGISFSAVDSWHASPRLPRAFLMPKEAMHDEILTSWEATRRRSTNNDVLRSVEPQEPVGEESRNREKERSNLAAHVAATQSVFGENNWDLFDAETNLPSLPRALIERAPSTFP